MSSSPQRSKPTDASVPFPSIEDETPRPIERRTSPKHKKSISSSLFSRLNVLRSSDNAPDEKEEAGEDPTPIDRDTLTDTTNSKVRKRKGSLRKAVLGRPRDRRGSEKRSPLSSPLTATSPAATPPAPVESPEEDTSTPRASRAQSSSSTTDATTSNSGASPRWPFRTLSRVSIPSIRSSVASFEPPSSTTSIITSPAIPIDSTEEDEELHMPSKTTAPRKHTVRAPSPLRKPSSVADSYFPPQPQPHSLSPLSSTSPSLSPTNPSFSSLLADALDGSDDADVDGGHDYTPTHQLGILILITTWLLFVVGMGSSLGIWSWAWDVGETPYAPPELEDDPTLPITGYYPALMVLTGIMAWIWVLGAWVGMKYFRHSAGG